MKGEEKPQKEVDLAPLGERDDTLPICPICLEPITPSDLEEGIIGVLKCRCEEPIASSRHRACLIKWLSIKGDGVCDLCRTVITNLGDYFSDEEVKMFRRRRQRQRQQLRRVTRSSSLQEPPPPPPAAAAAAGESSDGRPQRGSTPGTHVFLERIQRLFKCLAPLLWLVTMIIITLYI